MKFYEYNGENLPIIEISGFEACDRFDCCIDVEEKLEELGLPMSSLFVALHNKKIVLSKLYVYGPYDNPDSECIISLIKELN